MFELHADLAPLVREGEQSLRAFERAVYAGLDRAARLTAEQARSQHWYRNRTGDLERSTQAQEADGAVFSDGASSSVVAQMQYASFVDARSRILEPAYELVRDRVEADVATILEQALR